MIPMPGGGSFIVIGENIHASRSVKRTGPLITSTSDGRDAIRFIGPDGDEMLLAIPDAIWMGSEFASGRVRHVKSAILAGLAGRKPDAVAARDYVRSLALRQEGAGADYLDLNVDEAAADAATRVAAIRWLVEAVEEVARVPVAIDSSDGDVIEAGLAASRMMLFERRDIFHTAGDFYRVNGIPGNRGVWVLRRTKGGRAHFLLMSLWDSLDSVRAFAGPDVARARYYPEDDRFLVARETFVRHYQVH